MSTIVELCSRLRARVTPWQVTSRRSSHLTNSLGVSGEAARQQGGREQSRCCCRCCRGGRKRAQCADELSSPYYADSKTAVHRRVNLTGSQNGGSQSRWLFGCQAPGKTVHQRQGFPKDKLQSTKFCWGFFFWKSCFCAQHEISGSQRPVEQRATRSLSRLGRSPSSACTCF